MQTQLSAENEACPANTGLESGSSMPGRVRPLVASIPWAMLAIGCLFVLWACNKGFDLTDESYYVAWMVDPSRYGASIQPFGLPLSLLFKVTGGSIFAMRVFGLALLVATGAVLGWSLDKYYRRILPTDSPFSLVALGGFFGLAYYGGVWVTTPNYNLLADAGMALVMAGAIGWYSGEGESGDTGGWVPSLLVGIGGFAVAFGKPTSAAVAAVGVCFLLLQAARLHGVRLALRRGAIAATACLLPLVIILLANDIGAVWHSVQRGLAVLQLGNSPGALPMKTLSELYHSPALLVLAVSGLVFELAASPNLQSTARQSRMRLALLACLANLLLTVASVGMAIRGGAIPFNVIGVPLLGLGASVVWYGMSRRNSLTHSGRKTLVPIGVLLLLPVVIAFGTANSLLEQTSLSLFAVFLAVSVSAWVFLPGTLARWTQAGSMLLVALLLLWSASFPYGLPASLWTQTEAESLPFSSDVVYLDRQTSNYVSELSRIAALHKLDASTPVIDLSGGGPGTALFLRGRAPFYPWLVHISPGSGALADAAWESLTEEEKRSAWIVGPVHPAFSATRPARLLAQGGRRYFRVAGVPMRFWGQDRTIEIWRPVDVPH